MGDHIQLTKKEDAKEKKNCNFPPYPEDVNHLRQPLVLLDNRVSVYNCNLE